MFEFFLECLSANKSLFSIFDIWLFSVRFPSIVKPSSFHSVILSGSVVLQQICSCSFLSLCRVDSCFDVISINFVLPMLNTRLVSIDQFTNEVRSFSGSFIHVSFLFILHHRYKVKSSAYCVQLLFGVMLDTSATHRLNKIEPSIEPCGSPDLAVRTDEHFESICTKCCLCVK